MITGFSLDPVHGLGLTTNPKKLKVSKPFVVSCDLPKSVQIGEVLSVPVVVHNHMDKDIITDVTIHNQEHLFRFVDADDGDNNTSKIK